MELPQPSRPYATEGRKTTHDFLSLYSHSPVQQDPRPSSHGGHLKTHNFLQPLEKEDNKKKSARENSSVELNVDKPPPTAQPCTREHVLHGGIGTYSISHISSFNPRMPKPEGSSFTVAPPRASSNERNDDNSSSSYTAGSSFTLWEEPSSSRKGKTGKENLGELNTTKEQVVRAGQLQMDRPSDSSSNHHNSFSTRSSSQPPAQKNQSFMEMLHSTEGISAKEEDEDESEFTLRKEITSRTGDLNVKVDGKGNNDQKANTPRSKHSATEQRRRCKINDRFQMLRQIIPNSDQKRDKASFLLEVIEYIHLLQDKVSTYEGPHPSLGSEFGKLTPWSCSPKLAESFADQPQGVNGPVIMFQADDNKANVIPTIIPRKLQNPADQNANNPNKATPISVPIQADVTGIFPTIRNEAIKLDPRMAASRAENASVPQPQLWQGNVCSSDFISPKSNQEMAIEGGTINISSMYSQGLLDTLTQALKSSGVDLSQATISVQVDLGKRASTAQNAQRTPIKEFAINNDNSTPKHERAKNICSESSNQAVKRLKTVKS